MLLALLQWCRLDPTAAGLAYADLPDQMRDVHTLEQMAMRVAASSLSGVRELLLAIPDKLLDPRVLAGIVRVGVQSDPAGVAEYALPLAEDPDHHLEFDRVIRSWYERDPAALERWIVELPAGRAKDLASTMLARAKARKP